MPLATQENMKPSIAKLPSLPRKRIERLSQHRIALLDYFVSHRHTTAAVDPTRPLLAHLVIGRKLGNRLSLRGGPIAKKMIPQIVF